MLLCNLQGAQFPNLYKYESPCHKGHVRKNKCQHFQERWWKCEFSLFKYESHHEQ